MEIPMTELARRICLAEHPHYQTTRRPMPCAEHLRIATNLHWLITPRGARVRHLLAAIAGDELEETIEITGEVEIVTDVKIVDSTSEPQPVTS